MVSTGGPTDPTVAGELPWPDGWPRPTGARRVLNVVIVVVVLVIFGSTALGQLGVVGLLRGGPVPWTGAAGVALLVLAPAVTVGAGRRERERLVETGPEQWVLRFRVSPARQWRTVLLGLGVGCLFLVWATSVVGVGAFFTGFMLVVMALAVGPLLFGALASRGADGVDLSATGVAWHTPGGRVWAPWSAVTEVVALTVRRGENGTRQYVAVRVRDAAAFDDGRWWPPGFVRRQELRIPIEDFAVAPERLYWACRVACDPERREGLLHGTDLATLITSR